MPFLKMIFFKALAFAILLVLLGGFAYFSLTDIPIHQSEKTETFAAEHFKK